MLSKGDGEQEEDVEGGEVLGVCLGLGIGDWGLGIYDVRFAMYDVRWTMDDCLKGLRV